MEKITEKYRETRLFKRAANGTPQEWWIRMHENNNHLGIGYGKVNGTTHLDSIEVTMAGGVKKEYESRIAAKRKEGYKELCELHDSAPNSIDNDADLFNYLNSYLPVFNIAGNGQILPMLAKTLENNKIFEKFGIYRGQWKINGLRCEIGAKKNDGDLFKPISLIFQSREGTVWNIPMLEEKLLNIIPDEMIEMMVDEGAYLDGEIYCPGCTVNVINHMVKTPDSRQQNYLQYWLYDLAVENMPYKERRMILEENFSDYLPNFHSSLDHVQNTASLVFLPEILVSNYDSAVAVRDNFIDLGFEGLILRNPEAEYGFGKRSVGLMHKFKKIEDGKFEIMDIIPEGKKRTNLCKLVLKNDINDELFECTINGSHSYQEMILNNREEYLHKTATVQFRERSGVNQVPFHAKAIDIN